MAITTLRGTLEDDAILAAVSQAEFGDPAVLDPAAYQLVNFIVNAPDSQSGERTVQYDIAAK